MMFVTLLGALLLKRYFLPMIIGLYGPSFSQILATIIGPT
jgi:hypothetical protein